MVFVNPAWRGYVLVGNVGSESHDLAHHPAGTHDGRTRERHVRGADVTAGYAQVLDVVGIKTAVWNRARRHFNVLRVRERLLTFEVFAFFGIREMQVDRPGGGNGAVGVRFAFLNVHLV